MKSIFVSIANYRDNETPHTVRDLYAKASYPERVFAGVLSQVVPEEVPMVYPTQAFLPGKFASCRFTHQQAKAPARPALPYS